jgi:hypothetical protein
MTTEAASVALAQDRHDAELDAQQRYLDREESDLIADLWAAEWATCDTCGTRHAPAYDPEEE